MLPSDTIPVISPEEQTLGQAQYLPEHAQIMVRAPGGLYTYRRAILVHALLDLLLYGAENTEVGLMCQHERIIYRKTGKREVQATLYLGPLETSTLILPQEHVHLAQFLEEQGFTLQVTRLVAHSE